MNYYPPLLLNLLGRFWHTSKPLPCWVGKCLLGLAQFSVEQRHYRIRRLLLTQDSRINSMLAFTGTSE